MGSPKTWRMQQQHQPVNREEDSVEVSEVADVDAVAVAVEEAGDVVVARRKRSSGNQSPSSDALSRMARSSPWRRSTSPLFPSRSTRSTSLLLDLPSRMRFSRSCLSRSRLVLVNALALRPSWRLVTTMDTLVWV